MPQQSDTQSGFTMIEIMVVTSIIVILMLIAIPAFIGVQQKATRIKCSGKIRKIMSIFQSYSHSNKGRLPRTGFFANRPNEDDTSGGTDPLRYDSDADEYLARLSIWRGDVANDLFLEYFESPDNILREDDPDAAPDLVSGMQTENYKELFRFVEKFFCPTSFEVSDKNLPDRWYGADADDNAIAPWRSALTPDTDETEINNLDYFPRETSYFSTVTAHLNDNTRDDTVSLETVQGTLVDRGVVLLAGRPGSVLIQDQIYIDTNGKYVSNHNEESVFASDTAPVGGNIGYLDGSVAWVEWFLDEDDGSFYHVSTTTSGEIYLANDR